MLASMLLQRAHGIPSAAISTIAPVRIGDLEPESRAVGRVLHGFLAADALMIDGSVQVLTMLEDSSGESVLLAIKHPVVSNASEVEVRAKFPRGSRSRRWCGRWTIWARSRRWSRGFSAIQGWIRGPTGPSRLTIPRTSRCSLSLARISSMDFKMCEDPACDRDAAARLLEMAMKSPRVYKQLLSLVCEVAGDEREVPGMETFRPNWTTAEDWPICSTDSSGREALEGIEVKRTFEIVTKASYHPSSSRGFVYLATWILPTIPAFQTSAKRTLER
ncbi:hypothetical protein SELMODRAFT_417674 [Selaginella moellendorffii]|uniref:Uncharacterized protein n=1 Tax=Selaginella moellendorffii TaxID=88036 RepID=D8S376_SELML|nr:hypothetical protein SELMODRAFT_417674 [Selaginella moellendorffii]